jgi:phenylalanyl-tRNA synthetase beta subunit
MSVTAFAPWTPWMSTGTMEEIQKGMTFIDFCELRLSRNQIKNETRRNQSDSFRKLKAFRKEIYFEDINYSFVNRFDQYLRGLGLATNTVRKAPPVFESSD